MIEARITCKTRSLRIGDLGLTLTRNEVVFLPREKAAKSKDLIVSQNAGAVEIQYVQRARVTREPPRVQPSPPSRPVRNPEPSHPAGVPNPEVAQAVREAVGAGMAEIRTLLKGLTRQEAEVVAPMRETIFVRESAPDEGTKTRKAVGQRKAKAQE